MVDSVTAASQPNVSSRTKVRCGMLRMLLSIAEIQPNVPYILTYLIWLVFLETFDHMHNVAIVAVEFIAGTVKTNNKRPTALRLRGIRVLYRMDGRRDVLGGELGREHFPAWLRLGSFVNGQRLGRIGASSVLLEHCLLSAAVV